MSTITIPQPELTTEQVSVALRKGLGPRYQVLPGGRSASSPPSPAGALAGAYPRQARTAWTSSAARLSFRSCRIWLTT